MAGRADSSRARLTYAGRSGGPASFRRLLRRLGKPAFIAFRSRRLAGCLRDDRWSTERGRARHLDPRCCRAGCASQVTGARARRLGSAESCGLHSGSTSLHRCSTARGGPDRRHPFEVMSAGAWRRTMDAVTKTAPLPDTAAVDAGRMRGRRRALVWTLIVLASLIALGSILTTWVHRQMLDNQSWKDASAQLIADPEVQN